MPQTVSLLPGPQVAAAARQRAPQRLVLALGLGLALAMAPGLQARAFGAPDSFADLAEQFSPAVVNITTSAVIAASTEDGPMVPPGSPFEKFFQDFMDRNACEASTRLCTDR